MADKDDHDGQEDLRAQIERLQGIVSDLVKQRLPSTSIADSDSVTSEKRTPPGGQKRKRRTESDTDSDGDDEGHEEYQPYCPKPEEKVTKWKLATNQEDFFRRWYQNSLDREARDKVETDYPPPDMDIIDPQRLDNEGWWTKVVASGHRSPKEACEHIKTQDLGLVKIHYTLKRLAGPVLQLFNMLDEGRKCPDSMPTHEELLGTSEAAAMMLAQAYRTLVTHRQSIAVNAIAKNISFKKVRDLMNEQTIFGSDLLPECLKKALSSEVTVDEETKKLCKELNPKRPWTTRPFRGGPHPGTSGSAGPGAPSAEASAAGWSQSRPARGRGERGRGDRGRGNFRARGGRGRGDKGSTSQAGGSPSGYVKTKH